MDMHRLQFPDDDDELIADGGASDLDQAFSLLAFLYRSAAQRKRAVTRIRRKTREFLEQPRIDEFVRKFAARLFINHHLEGEILKDAIDYALSLD